MQARMQYLAKVQKKAFLGGAELLLLAQKTAEQQWEVLPSPQPLEKNDLIAFQEEQLVIVDVDGVDKITSMEDATPWILEIIEAYLTQGVTAEALAQEIERAERWRQSLTLKSQEVDRRALETAARRDEIQELERNLKQEQEALERRRLELEELEAKLNQVRATQEQ